MVQNQGRRGQFHFLFSKWFCHFFFRKPMMTKWFQTSNWNHWISMMRTSLLCSIVPNRNFSWSLARNSSKASNRFTFFLRCYLKTDFREWALWDHFPMTLSSTNTSSSLQTTLTGEASPLRSSFQVSHSVILCWEKWAFFYRTT